MKVFKINENQFKTLLTLMEELGDEANKFTSFPNNVSATNPVFDENGEYTEGKPVTMDDITDKLTNQSFMDGHRKW